MSSAPHNSSDPFQVDEDFLRKCIYPSSESERLPVTPLPGGSYGKVFLVDAIQHDNTGRPIPKFCIKEIDYDKLGPHDEPWLEWLFLRTLGAHHQNFMCSIPGIEPQEIYKYHVNPPQPTGMLFPMEYCNLGNLWQVSRGEGPLSTRMNEPLCRHIIKQIIQALWFLKQNHILHRDLKSDNILLTGTFDPNDDSGNYNGIKVKIADYGLTREYSARILRSTGWSVSRPTYQRQYQAPELYGTEEDDNSVSAAQVRFDGAESGVTSTATTTVGREGVEEPSYVTTSPLSSAIAPSEGENLPEIPAATTTTTTAGATNRNRSHRLGFPAEMYTAGIIFFEIITGKHWYELRDDDDAESRKDASQRLQEYLPASWSDARHFLEGLLQFDPLNRLEVEQAWFHPWLRMEHSSPPAPSENEMTSLQRPSTVLLDQAVVFGRLLAAPESDCTITCRRKLLRSLPDILNFRQDQTVIHWWDYHFRQRLDPLLDFLDQDLNYHQDHPRAEEFPVAGGGVGQRRMASRPKYCVIGNLVDTFDTLEEYLLDLLERRKQRNDRLSHTELDMVVGFLKRSRWSEEMNVEEYAAKLKVKLNAMTQCIGEPARQSWQLSAQWRCIEAFAGPIEEDEHLLERIFDCIRAKQLEIVDSSWTIPEVTTTAGGNQGQQTTPPGRSSRKEEVTNQPLHLPLLALGCLDIEIVEHHDADPFFLQQLVGGKLEAIIAERNSVEKGGVSIIDFNHTVTDLLIDSYREIAKLLLKIIRHEHYECTQIAKEEFLRNLKSIISPMNTTSRY